MRYVVAGYVVVLGILFLYAVQLVWRRRRLMRTARLLESPSPDPGGTVPVPGRSDDR